MWQVLVNFCEDFQAALQKLTVFDGDWQAALSTLQNQIDDKIRLMKKKIIIQQMIWNKI